MLKLIAGQQLKEFEAYRRGTAIDGDGRTARLPDAPLGKLRAAIAEIDTGTDVRARQLCHPATHRLIIRGTTHIREGDILMRGDDRYHVLQKRDPGLMGVYTVLLCERRQA